MSLHLGLYQSLEDTSIDVCKRSCKAFHHFAVRCDKDAITIPPYTNKLSDHLPNICEKLLNATLRTDWPNDQLRYAIPYDALVKVIQNTPVGRIYDLQKLLKGALSRLETIFKIKIVDSNPSLAPFVPYQLANTFTDSNLASTNNTANTTTITNSTNTHIDTEKSTISSSEEEFSNSKLSALCSIIEACVPKISLSDLMVNDIDDRIMHCLLHMFQIQVQEQESSPISSVFENALRAISAVIKKFGTKMTRYITNLLPIILVFGLQHPKETSVLKLSLGVVGDLCRALKSDMVPYYSHCDEIVRRVLELLKLSDIDRLFHLAAIDFFGSMALSLERGSLFTLFSCRTETLIYLTYYFITLFLLLLSHSIQSHVLQCI